MAGVPKSKSVLERLAEGSEMTPSGCIEWTRTLHVTGYGVIRYMGRDQKTHRVSYMANVGEIPPGICVCHRCDNRRCINPDHLFLGTRADNNADKMAKGRQPLPASTKLTDAQALSIWLDQRPRAEIAEAFRVSCSVVAAIKRRTAWVHVTKNLPPVISGHPNGERHPNSKLTESAVRQIRADTRTAKIVAASFGCGVSTVQGIRSRAAWRHLT